MILGSLNRILFSLRPLFLIPLLLCVGLSDLVKETLRKTLGLLFELDTIGSVDHHHMSDDVNHNYRQI